MRTRFLLAVFVVGVSLAATPAERATERTYQSYWSRQADRDAGRLIERGSVRPVQQALTRQDIERRISRTVDHQVQRQARDLLRDIRQQDRREQIRRRVNDALEEGRRQLQQRREQIEQRQQGEQVAKDDASSPPTDRRATADPVSVVTERRTPLTTTVSAGPAVAEVERVQDRIVRETDAVRVAADAITRREAAAEASALSAERVTAAPTTPVKDAPAPRPAPGPSVIRVDRPTRDALAPAPAPVPEPAPNARSTSGTSGSRIRPNSLTR